MAVPFATTCYFGLGTGITNAGALVECTGYTRQGVSFTGTALSGLTQSVSAFSLPTGPGTGTAITYGAIFDSLTAGNLLAYWNWNVINLTAASGNFAAVVVNIQFNTYVSQALNLSLLGGGGSSGSTLDAGAQIGTAMGNPLIAGIRLGMQSGGLTALGTDVVTQIRGGQVWQTNGVNVATLDPNGNLSLLGTTSALTTTGKLTVAGGGTDMLFTVGGTAVMSINNAGVLRTLGTPVVGTPA